MFWYKKMAICCLILLAACGATEEFRDVTDEQPVEIPRQLVETFWGLDYQGRVLITSIEKIHELCGDSKVSKCFYQGGGNVYLLLPEFKSDEILCTETFDSLVTAIFADGPPIHPFYGVELNRVTLFDSWCASFAK